jgi:hypothetical protein
MDSRTHKKGQIFSSFTLSMHSCFRELRFFPNNCIVDFIRLVSFSFFCLILCFRCPTSIRIRTSDD